ncbi:MULTISPECIES: EamA family transporter RarD [unclassified Agarivorans]|uniref:EamA family transporter RarD n=1 Tax=unclassified Agarivorans TaxID=2636026 RepID=UPI003D7D9F80
MNGRPSSQLYLGLACSALASCLFAFLPWYIHFFPLEAHSGNWLAAQRILWSSGLMLLLLSFTGQLPSLVRLLLDWRTWPRLWASALLVGMQFWVFIWAPANGQTLAVALGYFSLPIILVLVGRFVYQENLNSMQWAAVSLAGGGVAYAYLLAEGLSWVMLLVAFGYPLYFMLRRKYALPGHIAFSIDNLLLLPLAIAYLCFNLPPVWSAETSLTLFVDYPWIYYLGLGIAGTIPMLLFLAASNRLPLSLFGLMGYLEPLLVFAVGWLLGERLSPEQWPTYILIVLALLLLAFDGGKRSLQGRISIKAYK